MVGFYAHWIEDWWLPEIAAAGLNCTVTIAYCALLAASSNQPAEDYVSWPNKDWGVTLSALVAGLITVSTAAAGIVIEACLGQLKWHSLASANRALKEVSIHEEASRGALGSVKLLWRLRGRPAPSFGAILQIATLIVAPLAQQAVSTSLESRPVNGGVASLPIAANASFGAYTQTTVNDQYNALDNEYSTPMAAAILAGLFQQGKQPIPETVPQCSSGNCTFGEYNSLALCSDAVDVSQHIAVSPNGSFRCLPNGQCLPISNEETFGTVSLAGTVAQDDSSEPSALDFNSSIAFPNRPSALVDMFILYHNMTTGTGATTNFNTTASYGAVEFIVEWCIPRFTTTVTSGVSLTSRQPEPFVNFTVDENGLFATINNTSYSIDSLDHYALQRFFNQTLSGAVYVEGVAMTTISNGAATVYSPFWDNSNDNPSNDGTDISLLSTALPRLQTILNNTAISMTNYARSPSTPAEKTFVLNGAVFADQSIIVISWPYIVAPILYSLGSLAFLLLIMTQRKFGYIASPPIWKTSSEATLRALDPDLLSSMHDNALASEMSESSESLLVRLVPGRKGWRVVGSTVNDTRHVNMGGRTGSDSETIELLERPSRLHAHDPVHLKHRSLVSPVLDTPPFPESPGPDRARDGTTLLDH